MKIAYIANIRFPSERAHSLQIAKMCSAFVQNGENVELVVPNRRDSLKSQDYLSFYNLKERFNIVYIKSSDFKQTRIGAIFNILFFTLRLFSYLVFNRETVIYSREKLIILFASLLGRKTFIEIHEGRNGILDFLVSKTRTKAIFISNGLKDFYKKIWSEDRVLVAPDGFDQREYMNLLNKEDLRRELDLPIDRKIIVYTGSLYKWKGAQLLAQSANKFPECMFVFVGGNTEQVKEYKDRFESSNSMFLGFKPHCEVVKYLKSANLLVLPNSGKEKVSSHFTSPLKLFEYMASGTLILASDLPSIKEVLNDDNSMFFKPDDLDSLIHSIELALNSKNISKLTDQAMNDAVKYSWLKRTENILNFIRRNE